MVIRQHDIFRGSNDGVGRYLYVVQHSINSALPAVIMAPVSEVAIAKVITKLDIPIVLENRDLFVRMHYMAAVPRTLLRSFVENKSEMHDDVIAAIDILFSGF